MLKKFLGGLVFGVGFAIALLAVVAVIGYFALPRVLVSELESLENSDCGAGSFHAGPGAEIGAPPAITEPKRFVGHSASYGNGFEHGANSVLAAGPGRIAGRVRVDGRPLEGLTLRLALNGKAYSQWATSGPDGRYEVAVPHGEYRVDGYDLDTRSANRVLAGKIGHPRNPFAGGSFEVAEGAPGDGLMLDFVDPVVVEMPKRKYAAGEAVVARWQPYPGATEYEVQLWEQAAPTAYGRRHGVFAWNRRPVVREPSVNLADYGAELKSGHFYSIDVTARAGPHDPLSETPDNFRDYDFQMVAPEGGGG